MAGKVFLSVAYAAVKMVRPLKTRVTNVRPSYS